MIAFALVAITLNHLRLHLAYRLMLHGTGEQMAIHDLPPIADESGAILAGFRRDVADRAELAAFDDLSVFSEFVNNLE